MGKLSLDGELSPTNGIDTDKDTLKDWEEVKVDELIKLSNGNYTLPKVTLKSLLETLKRYDNDEYLFITGNTWPIYYLPILSDPTKIDTDGDKIPDSYHSDMYMEDDWYAFSDPNPCVSDITEISLKNDFFSIDYEYKGDTPENEDVNRILKNNNKAASYGGYQGWFGDYGYLNDYKVFCNQTVSGAEMHSHGSGIIAVADMFFYLLKGHGNSFSPKWDKLMYLGDGYTHLSFDMYTIYMIWISDAFYYHPIIKGTVSEYLDGNLVQAINMINAVSDLDLKAKWCASTNSDTCLRACSVSLRARLFGKFC